MGNNHGHTVGPLSSLTAEEIEAVREIIVQHSDSENVLRFSAKTTRFAYVGLEEPNKREVLEWQRQYEEAQSASTEIKPFDRRVRVMLLDLETGYSTDNVVSLTSRKIESTSVVDGSKGLVSIIMEEFELIGKIIAENEQYVAALKNRGLKVEDCIALPLSGGNYDHDSEFQAEKGRRIARALVYRRDNDKDHIWAHPIDGLSAYVDLTKRVVLRIVDLGHFPVPTESGNYDDPEVQGPPLKTLKPIEITQPEGPSFTVTNEEWVEWANWRLQVCFDMREGLILRQVSYADPCASSSLPSAKGTKAYERRPILYRASINEMVVPYGDPSPVHFWQCVFDTGEYNLGRFTNSLRLGCDCLGEIYYFNAVVTGDDGKPMKIENAICMHEEDTGTLWKHNDYFSKVDETRRGRRLVISAFMTAGNYDYGFFWYFYLDGMIECEVKMTGFLWGTSYPGCAAVEKSGGNDDEDSAYPYATEVAPGLGGPFHQHLFSARLDMMVDGVDNFVEEVDAVRLPIGPTNPYGNAFTRKRTLIKSEAESGRLADTSVARTWVINSAKRTNRMQKPTAYALIPHPTPTMLADPSSTPADRALFAQKHLWVTQYDQSQRWAAGDYVYRSPPGLGMAKYIAKDRKLDSEDGVVLWHTFGATHFPRLEDWPMMPVDCSTRFTLKPAGFFDRNPTLNVPPTQSKSSHRANKSACCKE